jgi:hypothetical protein
MNTMTHTKTEQVIFEMLTENTGTHMLDSGGDDGRKWQQNAKKSLEDFKSEPYATIDPKYGDSSLSTFHYLNQHLKFSEGMNLMLEEFAKDYPNESWRETVALFLDALGVTERDESIEDGRWEFNTYNFDQFFVDQCLQGYFFYLGSKEYVALQIHGGADVRGGYTAPKIFEADRYEFILDANRMSFRCPKCESLLDIEDYLATYTDPMNESQQIDDPTSMPVCGKCGTEWVAN